MAIQFPIRYVAQIIVEAKTPLAVGSDSLYYDQDSPVEKDFNDLPYIPGTAIAGYLRKKLPNVAVFGDNPDDNKDQPKGSNIIISEAFLLDDKMKVRQQPEEIANAFLKRYFKLPIRQHTAINEYGSAKEGSKFDTEVVFKGSRFKFEIELQLEKENDENWKDILNTFYRNDFYLGSGEFNNFGELKVIEIKETKFDLSDNLSQTKYLNHDVDLNSIDNAVFNIKTNVADITKIYNEHSETFFGKDSFFHFGAGLGDIDVDAVNYQEPVIEYKENKLVFKDKDDFVIPGTSVKGALAHRVAFHYNRENENYVEDIIDNYFKDPQFLEKFDLSNLQLADNLDELEKQKEFLEQLLNELEKTEFNPKQVYKDYIEENNAGVKAIFGNAKDSKNDKGAAGKVIIKDVFLDKNKVKEHIFYHNKIDRFTGGTIDSALYSEKVLSIDEFTLKVKTKKDTDTTYLNKAIEDMKNGMLPIGGLVNKGHGIVTLKTQSNDNE